MNALSRRLPVVSSIIFPSSAAFWNKNAIFKINSIHQFSTAPAHKPAFINEKENIANNLHQVGARREKIEVDGMYINWDQEGTGDNHIVLCMPGIIGCIQSDYIPIFKKMNKEKFTVVSWDPPGYGRSRPPSRDFSGNFYKKDAIVCAKLMEKLGYNKYSILGWSNGGIAGCHLAGIYPERVRNIVTWGAHSFADERSLMFSKMMGNLDMWSEKMKAPMLAMYGEKYLLKMLKDWAEAVEAFKNDGLDREDKENAEKVACPALIIHGEEDPVLGIDHAEYLISLIKRSRLHVFKGAKHNLHLRYTDEFLELVEDFLLTGQ